MFSNQRTKRRHNRGGSALWASLWSLLAAVVAVALPGPAHAASLQPVPDFGDNPGNLLMFKYIPDQLPANAPLVVALHGCFQSAAVYDGESGWVKMADTYRFALLFPQQQEANDPGRRCFNWFLAGDNSRGQGEAASIISMVDNIKTNHSVDASRVFVTGLSGGAFMASNMIAAYPDVFAGGGIVAGGPAKCANQSWEAFACANPGVNKTPQQWGDIVRAGFPSWSGSWPKVSIWNGTADTAVSIQNLTELMEQWTHVHGADQIADELATVQGYPRTRYHNGEGAPVVETWSLTGQPHGQPLDPGTGETKCGVAGGAGMVDMNICAAYQMVLFFGLNAAGGDTEAPTASITSPVSGAEVTGTVQVSAAATDNVAVTTVEFYVDDGNLIGTDTTEPYSIDWDTSAESNGRHTLTAKAYDAAHNVGTSGPVTVTVTGGGGGDPVAFSSGTDDGYVKAYSNGTGVEVGASKHILGLAVGRGIDAKINRAVLSFDTSALPDNAVINRAYLTVTLNSSYGNPWANPAGNQLLVEVQTGCLGPSCDIETADWSAAVTQPGVGQIAQWASGTTRSTNWSSAGLSAINRIGKTQVKLRFSEFQTSTAYVILAPEVGATLTVEYSAA
ncbi:PHB depolymerase family esterase [Plantactinospora sp. GCM10030261]|uniref:extracellular catalytic domain type 1 short-chain-length polyhydroxyalkanoate depolymerase n=1 Tax=Plantactinospora sp. GCM10030261 TaxID=3273420 RepID=UPI00361D607A